MSHASTASGPAAAKNGNCSSGFVVPLIVYAVFAAIVYVIHGSEPTLSIDHISYFKLADEIRANYPNGDYWRDLNSVRAFGVILAYLYPFTDSHIGSLKLLLAGTTVAYLFAFQVFMGLATRSRSIAVGFSVLSALFVSFGASIWGMTEFAASLNRTLVLPFVVLVIWHFLRKFDSPWRYAAFPFLILLSLLHLSALHVFLVLLVFEGLDFLIRRRCRVDLSIAYFAIALVASVALQGVIEHVGAGMTGFIGRTVAHAVPEEMAGLIGRTATQAVTGVAKESSKLSAQEAWTVELIAFPWRNLPPSFGTLATIVLSSGVILFLSIWGALVVFRSGVETRLDKLLLMFAGSVLVTAYGLQSVLWVLRHLTSIYPVNFEEIRAINLLMIPAVYFVFRLYECVPSVRGIPRGVLRTAIVVAFVLQPILVIRMLPSDWRGRAIDRAVAYGLLKRSDTIRILYARQFLGLAQDGPRFYYSARPVISWLEANTGPSDLVLTNLNELHQVSTKSVGPFLKVVKLDVWDSDRVKWAASMQEVDRVLATRNIDEVVALARKYEATYAIVTWPVKEFVYRDEFYSVVRIR